MKSNIVRLFVIVIIGVGAGIAFIVFRHQAQDKTGNRLKDARSAPVEVAEIQHGPIVLRRIFSGTLEAMAKFVVAPTVGGRIERLRVDLADRVKQGQAVSL